MISFFQNELKMIGICLILSKFAQRIIKEGYEKDSCSYPVVIYLIFCFCTDTEQVERR